MYTILLVVLILMLLGALPAWPYSRSWGYYPSGGLGLIVVVVLVLLLAGVCDGSLSPCFAGQPNEVVSPNGGNWLYPAICFLKVGAGL